MFAEFISIAIIDRDGSAARKKAHKAARVIFTRQTWRAGVWTKTFIAAQQIEK